MSKPLFSRSGYSTSSYVLEQGGELDLAALPAFLRVLLTTDGTVTKSLESFFWEPVSVVKTFQEVMALTRSVTGLHKVTGEEVLLREVRLQGELSGAEYARATSWVCRERLPEKLSQDLEHGKVGIGELLRECGLETYRELLCLGKETSANAMFITRTYRIVVSKQPVIQITEKFPLALYNAQV